MTAIANLLSTAAAMPPAPPRAGTPTLASFLDLIAQTAAPSGRQDDAEGGKPLPQDTGDEEDALSWLGIAAPAAMALAAPADRPMPGVDGSGTLASVRTAATHPPGPRDIGPTLPIEPAVAPAPLPERGTDGSGSVTSSEDVPPRAPPAEMRDTARLPVVEPAPAPPGTSAPGVDGSEPRKQATTGALPRMANADTPAHDADARGATRNDGGVDGSVAVTSATAPTAPPARVDAITSEQLAAAMLVTSGRVADDRVPPGARPLPGGAATRALATAVGGVAADRPAGRSAATPLLSVVTDPSGTITAPGSSNATALNADVATPPSHARPHLPDTDPVVARAVDPARSGADALVPAGPAPAARLFAAAIHRALGEQEQRLPDTAPIGTAPVVLTGGVAAAGVEQTGTLDMRHERWPAAMIERIVTLRDMAAENDTRLRLSPDMLGTIDVSLKRDGDAVQVQITAEQAQTRQMLADAQPRLAELADARGVKLHLTGGQPGSGERPGGDTPRHHPSTPVPARRQTAAHDDAGATDQRIA